MSSWEQTMLSGRPSSAMLLVRPEMACLDMVYGAEKTRGTWAEMEPLLMILRNRDQPDRGTWWVLSELLESVVQDRHVA